jgi:hypothetical protein
MCALSARRNSSSSVQMLMETMRYGRAGSARAEAAAASAQE